MTNPKLFNKKEKIFLRKTKSFFQRTKSSNDSWKEYQKLNNEIMDICTDILSIKEIEEDARKDYSEDLAALEHEKKKLEKKLIEIETSFYDIKKGLWIGIAEDLMSDDYDSFLLYLPWKNLHNHFEVYGTSGYGKSRLMASMLRQMIHFGWSIMAIDPKGGEKQEVAQWIYDFAAEAGRNENVMRIMATYPDLSDKGNILFGLGDDEIASMASSLTSSGTGVVTASEQFFSGQVYRTMMGILAGTTFLEKVAYTDSEIRKMIEDEVIKYQNFKDHKHIEEEDSYSFDDISKIAVSDMQNSEVKHLISPFTRTLITFRELSYYSNYDRLKDLLSLVEDYPISDRSDYAEVSKLKENAKRLLSDVTSKEKAFFEKVGDSLAVLLSQLAYGPIGSIMCDIRINPIVQRIRDKEGVIIIFQPAPMRFEKVSEMMIKCYTRMFLSLFGTIGTSGRGMYRRVAMVVDEAKPMMFPGIEEIYNKARQLGMTIGAFYQSRSDPKFKLGETLADIVQDNTATSIFMKQVSESSRVECAESFGEKKVAINVSMKEHESMDGRSTIIFEDRELVSPSDIDELGIGEACVKHYGKKYHVTFPYQQDPMAINVVMPLLDSEKLYAVVSSIEASLKNSQTVVDDYNLEEKEKVS